MALAIVVTFAKLQPSLSVPKRSKNTYMASWGSLLVEGDVFVYEVGFSGPCS